MPDQMLGEAVEEMLDQHTTKFLDFDASAEKFSKRIEPPVRSWNPVQTLKCSAQAPLAEPKCTAFFTEQPVAVES